MSPYSDFSICYTGKPEDGMMQVETRSSIDKQTVLSNTNGCAETGSQITCY